MNTNQAEDELSGFDEQGQNRTPDPSFVTDAEDPLLWEHDLEGPGTQQHRFNRGQHSTNAPAKPVDEGPHGGRYGQGGYDSGTQRVLRRPRPARSDESVLQLIIEQLWFSRFDTSAVDVAISFGAVTLSGSVSDRLAKWELSRLVQGLPGVVSVECIVRVDHAEVSPPERRTSFGPLDPRP